MNVRQRMKSSLYRSGKCLVGQEKNLATCLSRNLNFACVIVDRYVTVLMYLNIKSNTMHYITSSDLIWSRTVRDSK